jgi:hypothetical protein
MRRSIGCHGAIVTINGNIVDKEYRICTKSSVNASEIKAIRLGVSLAIKWRRPNMVINLFSDSLLSILGIRERIFKWKVKGGKLFKNNNNLVSSQSVYIEIMSTIVSNNLIINFYHQKAHVDINNYQSLNNAIHVFSASNYIRDYIDEEFIKFISYMNNIVDKESRDTLYRIKNIEKLNIGDALIYKPFDYQNTINSYRQLQGEL